jgi:hypothetical protein
LLYANQFQRDYGCEHTSEFSEWCSECRTNVIADIATLTAAQQKAETTEKYLRRAVDEGRGEVVRMSELLSEAIAEKAAAARARDEALQRLATLKTDRDCSLSATRIERKRADRAESELAEAQQEVTRLQRARVGDAEIIGAKLSDISRLTAQLEEATGELAHVRDMRNATPSDGYMLMCVTVDLKAKLKAAESQLTALRAALAGLVAIIDSAGLPHLSTAAQLGATSWYVKACGCMDMARAALSVSPVDTSPVLAFQAWCEQRACLRGPMTQDQYFLAQEAFFAAHPGQGPTSTVMTSSPVAPQRQRVVVQPATPGPFIDDIIDYSLAPLPPQTKDTP